MSDREVMQQALEALEDERYVTKYTHIVEAITALRKALEQPEQEPVAYDKTEINCFVQSLYDEKMQEGKHGHYETMFYVVHQAIKKVAPPAAQPEQEPVAWITPDGEGWRIRFSPPTIGVPLGWDALYTTPPAAQRPWVGLTDEDKYEMAAAQHGWEDLLIAAEAKLKERNGN
jgi:hypothetical protein